jgi:CheY-like chemotaxis protein
MTEMTEKVLCVDDDANILAAYQRQLRKVFDLEVATGPEEGLKAVTTAGPFAVVLADLNMPGMNGIEFLKAVKAHSPDTIRMMLTGNADVSTAMEAVNTGNIFRFLTKPCSPDVLSTALQAGIEQYFLATGERVLLKNTLTSCIKVLTEILSIVNRTAFSRAQRLRDYVEEVAKVMNLPDPWQYEVAAMLSQIGCITLPPRLLEKISRNEKLTPEGEVLYKSHPGVAYKLLSKIPRLGAVAQMIENQYKPFHAYTQESKHAFNSKADLGAQILRAGLDLDQMILAGNSYADALNFLIAHHTEYNPDVVAAFKKVIAAERTRVQDEVMPVGVKDLKLGMVTVENVVAKDGFLLVPKDHEITHPVLLLLKNVAREGCVSEPFKVRMPRSPETGSEQ